MEQQMGGAQGGDVIKEMGATLAQQAELLNAAAEAAGQAVSPEVGKMLAQAGALVGQAIEAMGMGGGGKQAMPQSPEQAGTNAEPANLARG